MRILFLDLASHGSTGAVASLGIIACVTNEEVRSSFSVDHRIGDHELLPKIGEALRQAQWTWNDLTHVACVTGPGGFMSLRIAVAFANTVAWERGIPAAGVHLSDLCAARMANDGDPKPKTFLWLHSTRKGQLFIRGFGTLATLWPEPVLMSLDDLTTHHSLCTSVPWTGELLPDHEAFVANLGLMRAPVAAPEDVLPGFLRGLTFGRERLTPWYGRGW